MSEPNLKAMTQAELLKYLEDDFMPRLLPKLANFQNLEAENARLKAEVERLRASSFVTAVPFEEYEKLKSEVERLRKDSEYERMYREVIEVLKEGKQR